MPSLPKDPRGGRIVPVRRLPPLLPFTEPTSPVSLSLVYHRTDPTPEGCITDMVEAQMDGPSRIFIRPDVSVNREVMRQVNSAILAAIGPDFRLFDGHLEELDPQKFLTDGSSVDLFKRNPNGGVWRTAELPAYPRDMASGWDYLAQIVVDSRFRDPNGPRRTRSILLPLEDLNLNVLSIRELLREAGLLSLEPEEIIESIRLEAQREEISQVTSWGTTDTRRLDLDGLPPVWLKTTAVASSATRYVLDLLISTSSFGADEGEPAEGVLVANDPLDAAVV